MSGLSSVLNIASAGLAAQTAGLDATGQNVANVNTPGYSRVTANLETTQTGQDDAGSVSVGSISRAYNQYTFGNLLSEQGKSGAADARASALTQTETIVAPSGGTVSDSINAFFTSLTSLEAAPADTSARTGVIQAATTVATSFNTAATGLATQRAGLLQQAQATATSLNSNLAQIASLNGQIVQAAANGTEPTSLEDQRDQLVSTVSTQIGAQVISNSDGVTLLAAGTALVSGTSASTVSVAADASNNLAFTVTRVGGATTDITSSVSSSSGTLGGIREVRDTDIAGAQSQLDSFANDFATAVNSVQSAGYGTDGVTGRNLFSIPTTTTGTAAAISVDPSVAGNPAAIAASTTAAGLPGGDDATVAMATLANTNLAGGKTPGDTFASLTATVGNASSAATAESTLRTDTVTQAQNLNSSQSGVSIDEEMTNLSQFQRAYQASAQVLQTADNLLGGLIQDLATS